MKVFSHRGALPFAEENSLDGLKLAADLGADAVECDVTELQDGTYVIYHDESLRRLIGLDIPTSGIDYPKMKALHDRAGKCLFTFDEILQSYDRSTPILLHIKMRTLKEDFLHRIRTSELPFLFGAVTTDVVRALREFVPRERVLGFIPSKSDYYDFYLAGAGNIRLWEFWLNEVQPEAVKKDCPGTEVWIMAKTENGKNEMTESRVHRCKALGADAILLDNAGDALKWLNSQKS